MRMKILDKVIQPGQSVQLNMAIARLHTHTKIEDPVIIERAKQPGPCLLLIAGIHGNEINGVEIVRSIVARGLNKPEKGTTICIPVLNVFGFLNQQREFPDGRDLNRAFPGTASGSLAGRFAHIMMNEIIPHIDYCIDYHTGGDGRFNYPQLRIGEADDELLELAKIFGTKFIKYARQREKSFREIAKKMNKKVLLFEGGKTLYLDKKITNTGIQGAINVMQHLGMRDLNQNNIFKKPRENQILIKSSSWIRAKYSGMFRSDLKLGKYVTKGEVIGTISDPFGDFEKEVKAPNNGFIICREHAPLINQGSALFHISTTEIKIK
jgi:predicted deacylase